MSTAEGFLRDSDRPDWVPITRFIQGSETPTFQSQFVHWTSYQREEVRSPTPQKRQEPEQFQTKQKRRRSNVHLDSLITRQSNEQQRVDASYTLDAEKFDTSGEFTLTIYRIENFKRELLSKKEIGVFYSGDSYVVHFQPVSSSLASPIVYFWLGRHSSTDEKGGAAFHAKELAGGKASHCRITQGKEPPHFVNLFRGKMVVRDGGVASGFNTIDEEDKLFEGEPELFHVKGTNERDTRAVQVGTTCASLNSADCFVLNCQKMRKQFVWYGKGSEEIERDYATRVASFLVEISEIPETEWTLTAFEEESEPEEFFSILGGKSEYMNAPELTESVKEPRLFQCSDASGGFKMEEIFNFCQEDLALDDVFILDVYTSVYVWVGPESNDEEKSQSFEIALEYVYACSNIDGRDPDTPVICTFAGFEPPMCTRD